MDVETEKVYVAIGTDWSDGFAALEWALRKWSGRSISIVILHAPNITRKDYVYTPIGKLPASSVSEEKLKVLDKCEEAKNDMILSKLKAFCGKVKAEAVRIEKSDDIIELMHNFKITKLVMSFTFMKSSSRKSRGTISRTYSVLRRKPDLCEVFVVCGGKVVSMRELNNEGCIDCDNDDDSDKGGVFSRIKESNNFKNWLGRVFSTNGHHSPNSPSSSKSNNSPDQWEKYGHEVEEYVNQLLSVIEEEEDKKLTSFEAIMGIPTQPDFPEIVGAAERTEVVDIHRLEEIIDLNRKEAKASRERRAKAEWAVRLSNSRAEELEAGIKEKVMRNADLKRELDRRKEELCELKTEVEEKRSKLKSILELQRELSSKLQSSFLAKSRAEIQLEKAVRTRADMVQEIEGLRGQRNILQRRIEFCKEKDAIGQASRSNALSFDYREFTAAEIRVATEDFSNRLRLKSAGTWTNVYRGRISHITVAIKMYSPAATDAPSQEAFTNKVKLLGHLRHPNLVGVIGFCSELKCIVFEYMHGGCLRDTLFSTHRNSKRKNQPLNWHARIRIASEVCSALAFLHKAQPKPTSHGNLNPSKILLDRNSVAKLHGLNPPWSYDTSNIMLDIRAFGMLLLQLLTGRNWVTIAKEAIPVDCNAIIGGLDHFAGEWPLDLVMELYNMAIRCLSTSEGIDEELNMTILGRDIDKVRKKTDELVAKGENRVAVEGLVDIEDSIDVPSIFLCPIYQDVMKNPHVAADGFSYELEAIEEWLRMGHNTSPMTNLKLQHKFLTPNHTLRSLIHDWCNKMSVSSTKR